MQRRLLRKHYFLPTEHGAWIWWIGPLLIGLAASKHLTSDAFLLALAALVVFMLRQPATIGVKALSGRRPRTDLAPAAGWATVDLTVAALSLAALVAAGHTHLLLLTVPAVLVFAWHLWLISRRAERGQMGVELVGAGVLALAASAAYWVSGGESDRQAWLLWGLTWLQSAASIVYVYLRLEQRRMPEAPPPAARWRMGARTLAYHTFNLAPSLALTIGGEVPWGVPVAFGLMLADTLEGIAHPPVGAKPTAIGFRQLGASISFVAVMVLAYRL
ncbi:MAG: YwiC-like family protein [Chloroflexota bacterium]